jgi:hypothetical protein
MFGFPYSRSYSHSIPRKADVSHSIGRNFPLSAYTQCFDCPVSKGGVLAECYMTGEEVNVVG